MTHRYLILGAAALLVIFPRSSASATVPVANAQDKARKHQMMCLREAKWPLRHSTAYRTADVRTKNQLRNSSTPEVRKMERVCRTLASTSAIERQAARATCQDLLLVKRMRSGDDARLHANRIEKVCTVLAEPTPPPMMQGNVK
ncbi:MAG: hypothetical protein B7Z26_07895 [Asticcacaulis sp. 32-58-5]|nr:MAG: hypothetical protein B7Z26_07895 [Asticcacaulis sp. 32-58-5]